MNVSVKAEREVAKGNLWKAKEILQGNVGHAGYKPEIYEQLGNVLLEMSDLADAGKFLFLCGVRKPNYEEAIGIFLHRYETSGDKLFNSFPCSAKLASLNEYPESVAEKLRGLGLPEVLRDKSGDLNLHPERNRNDTPIFIVLIVILLLIVVLIILGVVKLLEILF